MEVQITMVDLEKVQQAVTMLLEAIGEDPEREGLADTPKRVANMYAETMSGYEEDPKEDLSMIMVEAEHTCMTMRGIKKVGSKTVSMATRGQFKENLHMQKIIQDMVYSK